MRRHGVMLWAVLGVLVSWPIVAPADTMPPVPLVIRSGGFAVTRPLASLAPPSPVPAGLEGDLAGGEIPPGPSGATLEHCSRTSTA